MNSDLLAAYLNQLGESGTDRAIRSLGQVGLFLRWLSQLGHPIETVDKGIVMDFLSLRAQLGCKKSVVYRDLRILRRFFDWTQLRGVTKSNPAREIDRNWVSSSNAAPAYNERLLSVYDRPSTFLKNSFPLLAPHWDEYLRILLERGYAKSYILKMIYAGHRFNEFLSNHKLRQIDRITPELFQQFIFQENVRFQKAHGRKIPRRRLGNLRFRILGFLTYALGNLATQSAHPSEPPKGVVIRENPWGSKAKFLRFHRGMPVREISRQGPNAWFRTPAIPNSVVIPESLWVRYETFLSVHRGLRPTTISSHGPCIGELGRFLETAGRRTINETSVADLDAFLLRFGPRGLQRRASTLRSFFRFLHLNGIIDRDLASDIPRPRCFAANRWPKYIPWEKVRSLLASVDRFTHRGKKDLALLTLLANHGLRAREVIGLTMSDVDWINKSLLLRGRKNGTFARIPLMEETLQAMRDYLSIRSISERSDDPASTSAPLIPLAPDEPARVVRHYLLKTFGSWPQRGGAYLLRHSFAKALLDRGARLSDIGEMLGHRDLGSTFKYTRIATRDMREVAENYANLLC